MEVLIRQREMRAKKILAHVGDQPNPLSVHYTSILI